MYKHLLIEYGHNLTLEYRLRDYPIVQRWAEQLVLAQQQYQIDDPTRFYGFGSLENQIKTALDRINQCITLIKLQYPKINVGYVNDVHDQDTLNYWHHIFETYHGLLGQENPNDPLTPVLADLNVCVHRCESVARGAKPRHVVTYYGLPKTQILDDSDFELFTQIWEPGTVFLNYVEIGKTLEDLANDNDRHIGKDAFRPWNHFSADFNVKFFGQNELQANERNAIINIYYQQYQDNFGPWQANFVGGSLPIADLVGTLDLNLLETHQQVTNVTLKG